MCEEETIRVWQTVLSCRCCMGILSQQVLEAAEKRDFLKLGHCRNYLVHSRVKGRCSIILFTITLHMECKRYGSVFRHNQQRLDEYKKS